jgi:Predicted membrane protein (DUF2157)
MNIPLFEKLRTEGLINDASFEKIQADPSNKLLSVHWEIRTVLYLGVLLLTGGLGILVYKNIDTIGHQAILAFILAISIGCFAYCVNEKLPFSTGKVAAPNSFFDYIVLLGCLTFIIFIGYIQYQYKIFGDRYGLATFFPMLVLFFSAYYFDHLGVLSLAIANLGAWLGLTVTPLQLLQSNDFNSMTIIITGLLLGTFLIIIEELSSRKNIKKHFALTYANFGTHILFISCIAAVCQSEHHYLWWFLLLIAVAYYVYRKALQQRSFYFITIATIYTYIGLCYVVFQLLIISAGDNGFNIGSLLFTGSTIGMLFFLREANKKLKKI